MKDSEFYTVSEEWPQPPDESCTLLDSQTTTQAKPKKKTGGRLRKKMSESLAGVTAAAVAVVMVAGSLQPMKDAFEDGFLGDDFFGEEVPGETIVEDIPGKNPMGERCYICGWENCPYYVLPDGVEGLRLISDEEPEFLEYDPYAMNGFNTRDQETELRALAIQTETDERLVFRLSNDIHSLLDGNLHWRQLIYNPYVWGGDEMGACGFTIQFEDEKSQKDSHVVHIYLAYAPSGVCDAQKIAEGLEIQNEVELLQFNAYKVPNMENTEIHIYSDLGEEYNQAFVDCCFVEKFTEQDASFTLGKTMRLQEGTVVHRTFDDIVYYGLIHLSDAPPEKGGLWGFEAAFALKVYSINDMSINFASISWLELMAQWADQNDLAPKYDHQVCFPLHDLGKTAINGITYRCYATYADNTDGERYVTYMVIPQQEPEILISFSEYCSAEEMEALRSGLMSGEAIAETYEIFSQITLR